MQITIDIDEDTFNAAAEWARIIGFSTDEVIISVLRQGLGTTAIALPPLRSGLPQIRFDPSFDPTSDAILDLLEKIKTDDDLGAPLFIPAETRAWIDQTAEKNQCGPGRLAAELVEESLLLQRKWPMEGGSPAALIRSNGERVVTSEFVYFLMDQFY
jgi:hypothetical protein